jgi:outer membrane lipoprotein SlyB
MNQLTKAVLITPLLFASSILPVAAQNHHQNNDNAYYNGMRNGTRGGNYYNNRDPHYNNNYNYNNDRNYQNDHRQGGIGPGKGALIGGAGGAVLGAVFGGGLKGTLIGGAAGAGIGAVVGQAAQNNRNNDNYRHPY